MPTILLRVELYAGLCPSGKACQRHPNLWFSSLTPYANKKATCKGKWLFVCIRGGWILLRVELYAGLCLSGKACQRRPNLWFSSLTPYANKKTTCKGKWLFVWQGRLDSNQRNDGVRVRSLTAWRRPYVFKLIYFIKFVFFLQAF